MMEFRDCVGQFLPQHIRVHLLGLIKQEDEILADIKLW